MQLGMSKAGLGSRKKLVAFGMLLVTHSAQLLNSLVL